MSSGFWTALPTPLLVLAPLAGVTDAAFRRIIAKYGKPDAMWTEFVPAGGICSAGLSRLAHDLWKTDAEQPIVAQIYGCRPADFRGAAKLIAEMGFAGVDINMGCPARDVERRKAGAALIRLPELAREIVLAAQEGAGGLPVSVKTRIGYHNNEVEDWLGQLLEAQPAAVTIHARTRDEASRVPARWDVVAQAVKLRDQVQGTGQARTLIIGNGDVPDTDAARQHARQYGCEGVMLGRAVFGNPWLFSPSACKADLEVAEILDVLLEHTATFVELFAGLKPLELMKKHFKAYVNGFRGAAALRIHLMNAGSFGEIRRILSEFRAEEQSLLAAVQPAQLAGSQA